MLLEGAVSLSRYACSSCDDHWPCNGFTASTVPATGLRAVGVRFILLACRVSPCHTCAAVGCASVHR